MCRECGRESHHQFKGHLGSRRFLTKAEKVERLKSYAEELKKELAAVEERIQELNSRS